MLFPKNPQNISLTMALNQMKKKIIRNSNMSRKFADLGVRVCRIVCRHFELSAQVSVHYSSAHSVLPQTTKERFKMSLTGRTLNILGRSATRVRCTGLQRLRSEYAEGPGNVSV